MRWALFGNHPDGLGILQALLASGSHELAGYSGPSAVVESLRSMAPGLKVAGDIEEILADPEVQGVIVATSAGNRTAQARRALQSERPVLCVHPLDQTPDSGYELAMLRDDTRQMLVPLLPDGLHPGVDRIRELIRSGTLGAIRLIEMEWRSVSSPQLEAEAPDQRPSFPGWPVLRLWGGKIVELVAFAESESPEPGEPVIVAGRFEAGGMFHVSYLPGQADNGMRVRVEGRVASAVLWVSEGWSGPAGLTWGEPETTTDTIAAADRLPGVPVRLQHQEETWSGWDPWQALSATLLDHPGKLARPVWQDEVVCLELDDAVRRSIERRRASSLEFPEASEEVGFKGTMTLAGCGLLWSILVVMVLSAWIPWLGWAILPMLALFLGMQMLRWFIPRPDDSQTALTEKHQGQESTRK